MANINGGGVQTRKLASMILPEKPYREHGGISDNGEAWRRYQWRSEMSAAKRQPKLSKISALYGR